MSGVTSRPVAFSTRFESELWTVSNTETFSIHRCFQLTGVLWATVLTSFSVVDNYSQLLRTCDSDLRGHVDNTAVVDVNMSGVVNDNWPHNKLGSMITENPSVPSPSKQIVQLFYGYLEEGSLRVSPGISILGFVSTTWRASISDF